MASAKKSSADFIAAAQSILASNDEHGRKQMFEAAMQAMALLETPQDTVWRMIMSVGSDGTSLIPQHLEYLTKNW